MIGRVVGAIAGVQSEKRCDGDGTEPGVDFVRGERLRVWSE